MEKLRQGHENSWGRIGDVQWARSVWWRKGLEDRGPPILLHRLQEFLPGIHASHQDVVLTSRPDSLLNCLGHDELRECYQTPTRVENLKSSNLLQGLRQASTRTGIDGATKAQIRHFHATVPEVQQGGIRERRIPATRVPRLRLRAGGVSLLSQDSLRLQIQYLGNLPLGSNNRCVRRTFRIFRHFDSEQTLAWAASELLVDCAGKVTFIVIHFAHNLNGTPQL